VLGAAIALLAVAVLGAHDPPAQACTLIGCESGVSVRIGRLPVRAEVIEVCVGTRCRRARLATPPRIVFVPVQASSPRVVLVRVRGFSGSGRLVFSTSRRVGLRALQPNGPDCPPVCYHRALALTGGQLRTMQP
jgi:hypothetical protein